MRDFLLLLCFVCSIETRSDDFPITINKHTILGAITFYSCFSVLKELRAHNSMVAQRWAIAGGVSSLLHTLLHATEGKEVWLIEHKKNMHELPKELEDIKNFDFMYIPSRLQGEGECGLYSVINARAIQTVIDEGGELSAENIVNAFDRWLAHYNEKIFEKLPDATQGKLHNGSGLSVTDQWSLVRFFKVPHYHTFDFDFRWPLYGSSIPLISTVEPNQLSFVFDLDQLMREFGKQSIAHILLGTPSGMNQKWHAVLISIIRYKRHRPLVIYMDSNNYSLAQCDADYVVPFFVVSFLKMLDDQWQ